MLGHSVVNQSDIRLKTEVHELSGNLQKVMALRPVTFRWRAPHPNQALNLGFIAQEVEKVFPELVYSGDDGFKSMSYSGLITPVIGAIKEQQELVLLHEKKIEALEEELAALKESIRALEVSKPPQP